MMIEYDKLKPYLVSLLAHIALFVLLSAFMVLPFAGEHWHEISFEQPLVDKIKISEPVPAGQARTNTAPVVAEENRAAARQPVPEAELSNKPPVPQASNYIEPPRMSEPLKEKTDFAIPSSPRPASLLPGYSPTGDAIRSNVRSNIEGSDLLFRSPTAKHPFAYNGTVKLQFRINELGKLMPDTVLPLQYPDKSLADFAKKLLSDGTFSTRGTFNPEATYEITIELK